MTSSEVKIPINLPNGWTVEVLHGYGIVIGSHGEPGKRGFVTVDEDKRRFGTGIAPVLTGPVYRGRGWRTRLYGDAVAALKQAMGLDP